MYSLIPPFVVGGGVIAAAKYISDNIDDPALAAIIGGVPTGLLTVYFITDERSVQYTRSYIISVMTSLITALTFFILYTRGKRAAKRGEKVDKNRILLFSFSMWIGIVFGVYYIRKRDDRKIKEMKSKVE